MYAIGSPSPISASRRQDSRATIVIDEAVSRDGLTITAPIDESVAQLPLTPGSEFRAPMPQTTTPTVSVATANRSPVGAILAVVVAVLVVVLIVVLVNDDDSSNDDPTPATDPPATAPAATNAPTGDG